MPESFISTGCCYSKCFTGSADHHGRRVYDVLYRRKRNADLECRYNLFVVDGSNDTEHQCNDSRELYGTGYKRKRMPEPIISTDCCYSKSFTGSANNHSRRADNVLFGR
jgi:hypothetical protein